MMTGPRPGRLAAGAVTPQPGPPEPQEQPPSPPQDPAAIAAPDAPVSPQAPPPRAADRAGLGRPGGSAWRYGRPAGRTVDADSGRPEADGWAMFGYLISGMAVYGGIGWLLGRWLHLTVLFPIGMLVGLGLGILLIVLKQRGQG